MFVPDPAKFKATYEQIGATRQFPVLQGHPNQWDDKRRAGFAEIIEFLKSKQVAFMMPSQYLRTTERGARDTALPLLTNGSLDGRRRRGVPVGRACVGRRRVLGALIFGVLRNALAQIPGGTFADRLILGIAVLIIVVMDRVATREAR